MKLIILLSLAAAAYGWQPAPVTLKTPWGEKVTPENVWREYPRPQLARERWQNLNGLWEYAITPRAAAAPARYDGEILVPFPVESSLSGVGKILTPGTERWRARIRAASTPSTLTSRGWSRTARTKWWWRRRTLPTPASSRAASRC
ncbi:MAG: hypothetical protein MUC42_18430 [Bryobacter sp.]|nr:hypothetical protein [Bryobacter sp.]